jgi:hypothetical protein
MFYTLNVTDEGNNIASNESTNQQTQILEYGNIYFFYRPKVRLPSPFKPPLTTLLAFVRIFVEVLPVAPPAFDILPAAVPPAFDILPAAALFIVLLEEVPEDVEFDDLPLVGFDASPLGGVAPVIFDWVKFGLLPILALFESILELFPTLLITAEYFL